MSKRVHIISISWGMKRDIPVIGSSIKEAIRRGILIFACASNGGANYSITFPARLPRVFCIGSADGLGTQSDFSPPFPGEEKFSALGEAVLGARSGTDGEIRSDGTSISTPIAAGLAALLIQYTRQFTPKGQGAETYENMRKLFFAISKSTEGKDYRYLGIGILFETGDAEARIKRILTSPLGKTNLKAKVLILGRS
jgi:subtilisin family serine protease